MPMFRVKVGKTVNCKGLQDRKRGTYCLSSTPTIMLYTVKQCKHSAIGSCCTACGKIDHVNTLTLRGENMCLTFVSKNSGQSVYKY